MAVNRGSSSLLRVALVKTVGRLEAHHEGVIGEIIIDQSQGLIPVGVKGGGEDGLGVTGTSSTASSPSRALWRALALGDSTAPPSPWALASKKSLTHLSYAR